MSTETKEPQNLMDGLFNEMNRCRDLIKEYEALPGNVGMLGAHFIKQNILYAEQSIKENDVSEMLIAFNTLTTCE